MLINLQYTNTNAPKMEATIAQEIPMASFSNPIYSFEFQGYNNISIPTNPKRMPTISAILTDSPSKYIAMKGEYNVSHLPTQNAFE